MGTFPARRFRPDLEGLDAILSTSTISPAHIVLPKQGLVDLRSPQIARDLRDELMQSTPQFGRQGWTLNLIEGDPATRTVYGSATVLYQTKATPSFFALFNSRVKVKVEITFATNLDNPQVGDVRVSASHSISGLGPNVRNTIALSIVSFVQQDHNRIAAALH